MKRRGFIAFAAIAAAAAMPMQASAHHKPDHSHGPPPWAGAPGGPAVVPPTSEAVVAGDGAEGGLAPQADKPAKPAPPRRCAKTQKVGFAVSGTLSAYTEPELTVEVTEANKHARGWIADHGAAFDLTGATAKFEGVDDLDGNGTVGVEDAQAGDLVELGGKLLRPKPRCDGETTLRLDRVAVKREVPVPGEPLVP